MPGFAPGQLESLVGVTFDPGEVGIGTIDAGYDTATGSSTVSSFINVNSDGLTVISVDSTYTAASGSYFPTFGSITYTTGGNTFTVYIHGVSDGALMASNVQNEDAYFYYTFSYVHFVFLTDPSPTFPLSFSNDPSIYVAPCFAEGTLLATTRGLVAVEDLVEGDEMITASGAVRPAIWIGSRQVRCERHPNPDLVNPVRVRAGAFGDGVPSRDLRLSPGHAVWVDGVLIPVGLLINGATIVQEPVETIRYFHVELDAHDVVLAEGLTCESYLDDGNRETFGNAPGHITLHGRLDPQDWDQACAPILREGPDLSAVVDRLRERALALGWGISREQDVVLEADGLTLAPVFSAGQRLWFVAPSARNLVLRSPASTPGHTTFDLRDARRLGVALTDLRIDGRVVDLASEQLNQGFHPLERRTAEDGSPVSWRWTDGAGRLPSPPIPTMVEVEVAMVSPRWVAPDQAFNQASPFAPRLRLVEAG